MIDIHCHILPGVDDGAQSLEDTISMAETAVQHGIHTVIATPHHANGRYENEASRIVDLTQYITQEFLQRNIPLNLMPGQEIRVNDGLLDELDAQKLLTLNDSRYILLELPHTNIPDTFHDLLYELSIRRLTPIIAHPERNAEILSQPDRIAHLTEHGALLQVTADSLLGRYGRSVQKLSLRFCREGMTAFIASDAHNAVRSVHHLSLAYALLEHRLGTECVEQLKENAYCLTENMEIQTRSPFKTGKKWYEFWQ